MSSIASYDDEKSWDPSLRTSAVSGYGTISKEAVASSNSSSPSQSRIDSDNNAAVAEENIAENLEQFIEHSPGSALRSPSVCSFSDLTGRGTASSPIEVESPHPDAEDELVDGDEGQVISNIVKSQSLRTARRRIKQKFHAYFDVLDSVPQRDSSGVRRRLARKWLYEEVMEELEQVLGGSEEVVLEYINRTKFFDNVFDYLFIFFFLY